MIYSLNDAQMLINFKMRYSFISQSWKMLTMIACLLDKENDFEEKKKKKSINLGKRIQLL